MIGGKKILMAAAAGAGGAGGWNPGLMDAAAWWRMLSGNLTVDSTGNGNTLTNVNGVTECTALGENIGCALFDLEDESYFQLDAVNLSDDFPFKEGTTNREITFCTFLNRTDSTTYDAIYAHYVRGTDIAFFIIYFYGNKIRVGIDVGGSVQYYTTDTNLALNNLYHLGVSYDAVAQTLLVHIWDMVAGSQVGSDLDLSGVLSLDVGDSDDVVFIGARPPSGRWSYIKQGDIAVIPTVLGVPDINLIRQGIYGI